MTSPVTYTSPTQSPMVSYPDIADHTISIRHPPSVSSRSHTTRRSRHGRSHHGGSSHQPQNEFPFFAHTGDVEIIIAAEGQEQRYLLHRLILAQCSGFFEAGTSEQWSRAQAQREVRDLQSGVPGQETGLARIGEEQYEGSSAGSTITVGNLAGRPPPKMRWRYELDWDNTEEDEEPMLVQKSPSASTMFGGDFATPLPPPSRTKPPPAQSSGFFRSMANLTLGPAASTTHLPTTNAAQAAPLPEIVRDYDNLFRIFYNHPPSLNATNIASAYSECKALLSLADMYDALPVIGPRIDHHLLRFSSRLFKQIAKYPPSYLKLGYLARSRVIFSEALVHVVGQWPAALPHLQHAGHELPESVAELIEDKADELDEVKSKIEAKLFRLTLTTSRGERVNPANAYLDWLAVSLFRQWVAENTTPPPQPILKHSTTQANGPTASVGGITSARPAPARPPPSAVNSGRVYRLLGSMDPQAYLPHDELKRFLKCHPGEGLYSRDTLRRFERKMEEIKNLVREIVKPLMRNFLELDLRTESGGGLPYLTCTRVEAADLPWD